MTDEPTTRLDEMFDDAKEEPADVTPEYPENSGFEDEFDDAPRRRASRFTRVAVAGILLALAFTGGVLVQKHHDRGLTAASAPSFTSGSLPNFGGSGPPNGSGGGSGGSTGGSSTPAVIGTVVSVHGNRIVVRDLSGTKHVVTTTSSTSITPSSRIAAASLTAGTTVVVTGTKSSDGAVRATAITAR
jgi:hypothetical protein